MASDFRSNSGRWRRRAAGARISAHAAAGWGLVGLLGCAGSDPTPDRSDRTVAGGQAAEPSLADVANPGPANDPRVEALVAAVPARPPEVEIPDRAAAGDCRTARPKKNDRSIGVIISPPDPRIGETVRVVVASLQTEDPHAIRIDGPSEAIDPSKVRVRPGVPAMTIVEFEADQRGRHRVSIGRDGRAARCHRFKVAAARKRGAKRPARRPGSPDHVWPVRRTWSQSEEALFSAWVRELFHADPGADLAWKALHEATGEFDRNFLHDYLRQSEDTGTRGLELRPDCADTPYFLRAYYAWKRGLPFAFHRCSRGRGGRSPQCRSMRSNLDAPDLDPRWIPTDDPAHPDHPEQPSSPDGEARDDSSEPLRPSSLRADELAVAQRFFKRTLAWGVHTGNGRTAHGDAMSDFYPVALARNALRPGVMYADPYGHILVVVEWVAGHAGGPGILFAVDGQPDASITRKRFWEGNFLWNPDPSLGGSGFKMFRPVVRDDGPRVLDDEEIGNMRGYPKPWLGAAKVDKHDFYDRMEALITPGVRNPFLVQRGVVEALAEAVRIRVTSVNNGVTYVDEHPGTVVEMPKGHAVFETSGAWENYSTPARDLRLLIAMDVVVGFADKVRRNPSAFGLDDEGLRTAVFERLEVERKSLLAQPEYAIEYRRSDGSSHKLSLAEVVARMERFEMAYNPNDCPEIRWGADPETTEAATCDRRAPAAQRAKMVAYRGWFSERRRPARGDPGPEVAVAK